MIYLTALGILTFAAVMNRGARQFALVLMVNWLATMGLQSAGLYTAMPVLDGFTFSILAILWAFRPRTWWSGTCVALALATVIAHGVAYVAFYAAGLWYGDQYATALRTLFLIQMLVLVLANYDVLERISDRIALLRDDNRVPSGIVRSRHGGVSPGSEKVG